MSVEEEHLDVLQNIEAAIVSVYRDHPEMTDYDVDKAFSALIQTYRSEAVGRVTWLIFPNSSKFGVLYLAGLPLKKDN